MAQRHGLAVVAATVAECNTPSPDSQPHYTAEGIVVADTDKELFELQEQQVVDTREQVLAVIPTLLPGIGVRQLRAQFAAQHSM